MQGMHDTKIVGNEEQVAMTIDDYEVFCTNCDWFGMRMDCEHSLCPNCLNRVSRKKKGE